MSQLVLASTSPYRRDLLLRIGVDHISASPRFNEEKYQQEHPDLTPAELCLCLAQEKAQSLTEDFPDAWILASDQLVNLDGEILGKTPTAESSLTQLKKMRGRSHELLTSLVLIKKGETPHAHLNKTTLHFRDLSDQELLDYIARDQPFDCAGSYKIEKAGLALVEKMDCEDFSAIIGLPMVHLTQELIKRGIRLFLTDRD